MSRDEIDGVVVVARQKATCNTPVTNGDATLSTVEELLLADERTVFQCAHPDGPDCNASFDNATSALAHQSTHSARRKAAKLERELAERKQRRIDGSVKGAETKRRNRAQSQTEPESPGDDQIAEIKQKLDIVAQSLETLYDGLMTAGAQLGDVISALDKLPALDHDVVGKAARFDQLQSLMNTR